MTKNVGAIDRVVRAVLGVLLVGAAGYYWGWWAGAIGIVLLATAAMSWCPAYRVLGISTCKRLEAPHEKGGGTRKHA